MNFNFSPASLKWMDKHRQAIEEGTLTDDDYRDLSMSDWFKVRLALAYVCAPQDLYISIYYRADEQRPFICIMGKMSEEARLLEPVIEYRADKFERFPYDRTTLLESLCNMFPSDISAIIRKLFGKAKVEAGPNLWSDK